jgi:thiol:disulfide interchange protein DsbA
MAKAYYTLEALGLVDKLHVALFDAIHKQKTLNPTSEKAAIDWIAKQSGMDHKKVTETFNSFSVNTKVMRAVQVFRASGATGVPALIIDGKYLTSSTMAGGNDEVLKVADYIIANARKDKATQP